MTKEIRCTGDRLVSTLLELIHQGNVRNVCVRNEAGRTLFEFPLTFGVVGVLLAPTAAVVGALAALVTSCTIVVEKTEEE